MKKRSIAFVLTLAMLVSVGEAAGQEIGAVTDTWSYEIDTPQGTNGGTLMLTDSSGTIGGTINPDQEEEIAIENAELSGDTLAFEYPTDGYGTAEVEVIVEGDSLDGQIGVSSYGPFPFRATRHE